MPETELPPWERFKAGTGVGIATATLPPWERLKAAIQPSEKQEADQPSMGVSLWQSLKRGVRDVVESGAQIGAKMMQVGPEEGAGAFDVPQQRQAAAGSVSPEIERAKQAYQQSPERQAHPFVSGLGRVVGNIAASAPLAAIPGAGGAGLGLAGRASLGAGMGFATGGLPGAVIGGLTGGLGAAIGPMLNPEFQAIAQKFPTLASMATGRLGRTPEAFQRATANEVLRDVGVAVPPKIKVGEDLINHAHDAVDGVYDKILPQVTFRGAEVDPYTGVSFKSGLPNIAAGVPEAHQKDFEKLLENQIVSKLDAGGNMSGRAWKDADRSISREARYYQGYNASGDDRKYVDSLRELQGSMRDTLALHNPVQADALKRADASWHKLILMEEAAGRRIDSKSEFRPNDLLMVGRREIGNRRFAQGQGVLSAYGRAGNDLLAGKPPVFRRYLADAMGMGVGGGIGGAVGHSVGGPMGGYVGATAGAGAGLGVAEAARGAVSRARATPLARKTGEIISRIAPVSGGAGGSALDRATKRIKAAQKVGELQHQRYLANRRGDFTEYASLGKRLAEAHQDYRDLGGTA